MQINHLNYDLNPPPPPTPTHLQQQQQNKANQQNTPAIPPLNLQLITFDIWRLITLYWAVKNAFVKCCKVKSNQSSTAKSTKIEMCIYYNLFSLATNTHIQNIWLDKEKSHES